jgi:hypothetical protein
LVAVRTSGGLMYVTTEDDCPFVGSPEDGIGEVVIIW